MDAIKVLSFVMVCLMLVGGFAGCTGAENTATNMGNDAAYPSSDEENSTAQGDATENNAAPLPPNGHFEGTGTMTGYGQYDPGSPITDEDQFHDFKIEDVRAKNVTITLYYDAVANLGSIPPEPVPGAEPSWMFHLGLGVIDPSGKQVVFSDDDDDADPDGDCKMEKRIYLTPEQIQAGGAGTWKMQVTAWRCFQTEYKAAADVIYQ